MSAFNKTCTVYSAAYICISNGFFLDQLLAETWGGRDFWTKYCEVESLWMGLCISYQPIWVQIGFEVLPTSTMGLFPQHIKPCFQPL